MKKLLIGLCLLSACASNKYFVAKDCAKSEVEGLFLCKKP